MADLVSRSIIDSVDESYTRILEALQEVHRVSNLATIYPEQPVPVSSSVKETLATIGCDVAWDDAVGFIIAVPRVPVRLAEFLSGCASSLFVPDGPAKRSICGLVERFEAELLLRIDRHEPSASPPPAIEVIPTIVVALRELGMPRTAAALEPFVTLPNELGIVRRAKEAGALPVVPYWEAHAVYELAYFRNRWPEIEEFLTQAREDGRHRFVDAAVASIEQTIEWWAANIDPADPVVVAVAKDVPFDPVLPGAVRAYAEQHVRALRSAFPGAAHGAEPSAPA